MNTSKILWVMAGMVAVAMAGVFSFMLGSKEDVAVSTQQIVTSAVDENKDLPPIVENNTIYQSSTSVENVPAKPTSPYKSLVDQVTKGQFIFKYGNETLTLQDGNYTRNVEPKSYLCFSCTDASLQQKPRYVLGDLNADGKEDLVIFYYWTGGGSGGYSHLALFINNNGIAQYSDSISLGDSTSVNSFTVNRGILKVSYTTFPDQVTRSTSYKLLNNKIEELTGDVNNGMISYPENLSISGFKITNGVAKATILDKCTAEGTVCDYDNPVVPVTLVGQSLITTDGYLVGVYRYEQIGSGEAYRYLVLVGKDGKWRYDYLDCKNGGVGCAHNMYGVNPDSKNIYFGAGGRVQEDIVYMNAEKFMASKKSHFVLNGY